MSTGIRKLSQTTRMSSCVRVGRLAWVLVCVFVCVCVRARAHMRSLKQDTKRM